MFTLSLHDNVTLFYFVVAIFLLALLFLWRMVHSPFGKALQAIPHERGTSALRGLRRMAHQVHRHLGCAGQSGGLLAIARSMPM